MGGVQGVVEGEEGWEVEGGGGLGEEEEFGEGRLERVLFEEVLEEGAHGKGEGGGGGGGGGVLLLGGWGGCNRPKQRLDLSVYNISHNTILKLFIY